MIFKIVALLILFVAVCFLYRIAYPKPQETKKINDAPQKRETVQNDVVKKYVLSVQITDNPRKPVPYLQKKRFWKKIHIYLRPKPKKTGRGLSRPTNWMRSLKMKSTPMIWTLMTTPMMTPTPMPKLIWKRKKHWNSAIGLRVRARCLPRD